MKRNNIHSFFLILYHFAFSDAWIFSPSTNNFIDFTSSVPVSLSGFMTAFGDFNADRSVDIFILNKIDNMQSLDVILMAKENQKDSIKRITLFNDTNSYIRNVVVGDFNGDSYLDAVTYNSQNINGPYSIYIAYGVSTRDKVENPKSGSNFLFTSQPLHLDWNTDMIGDLFGQINTTEFVVLLGNRNKSFSIQTLPELSQVNSYFDELLYSYFVDLDQSGETDILLVGRMKKNIVLVGLLRENATFIKPRKLIIALEVNRIGQPVIADFLFNGKLQMIIPICMDNTCIDSRIIACTLIDNLCNTTNFTAILNGSKMGFQYNTPSNSKLSLTIPEIVPMSCGDVKMTGQIGCLLTVYSQSYPQGQTLVRLNNNGEFKFNLAQIEGNSNLFSNVTQVAIFDLLENGILDIITASQQGNSGIIKPLLQDASGDSYFLKVMVLNGLCGDADSCPGKTLPFGIPLPGSVVSYSTEGTDGNVQSSIVSMVSSSSYTSLMLPYAFFGLSTFSNYIEKLTIQLHYDSGIKQHVLTFIVPKTQIVIIPYPLDSPDKWKNKLFLEPFSDKKVIYVAAALLGTMFIVSIILCILQYLEVREDRLEKMQEAQKFNFDAM